MSAPDKLIRHFKQYMYEKGFIRSKTFVNDERPIVITDINKNSLLNNIAMNGLESYEHEVVLLIKNYLTKIFFSLNTSRSRQLPLGQILYSAYS